ncbi:YfjS/YafY family lipoprotein [Escherichia coli]|nr:YfjS/YafY family lipoprotein [Escherichia coli]
MKRKTLPLLALVATTLFLIACDDRSDDLKAISKFKDLTPPRFSDVVSHQDDVSEEWSQVDYLSGPTLQVLRTRESPDGCEGGSYYYLVDMQEKTIQPLMNALCIADNIKLEYQEVTDPYTKEKYFEYAHDGKLMGQLLIPSNPDNQE